MTNVNLINPHQQSSNRTNANECLLSSSSSSTSSSSSANQQNQLDYNNNAKTVENLNFNSRSLGTFQGSNYQVFVGDTTKKTSPLKTSSKNSPTNGSETNLSVKTAVKLLENSTTLTPANKTSNTYSSHSSLATHNTKNANLNNILNLSGQPSSNNNAKNQQSNGLNGSLLSFNKQKRSSSIDNVISSFSSNSQPFSSNKIYSSNNTAAKPETKQSSTSFSNGRSSTSNQSKMSNQNLYLSGTDLKDLLDSFNINTSKLTTVNGENSRDDSMNPNSNRSRSLHRDSSYYLDLNNQRKKFLNESSSKLKQTPSSAGDQNYSSNFNNSSIVNSRNQFDESSQNVLYNSSDLNSSSHIPKPPPGNPQRNTNLYPAAR